MAKLSRRKRKKLAENGLNEKNLKQERRKTPNEEGYVSKRSHSCWTHEYQSDKNGNYVCSICGYRTKDLSVENALQEYFSSRTDYKISEIKELMQGLRKVAWYRNTRGQRIYYPIEEVTDVSDVMIHFGNIYFIFDINDDGSFPELESKMSDRKRVKCEKVLDIRNDDYMKLLKENWIQDNVRNTCSSERAVIECDLKKLRKRVEISKWYCEATDGKIHIYDVWKKLLRFSSLEDVEYDFTIKQYVYGKDNKLEEIIYRDQDVTYSLSI